VVDVLNPSASIRVLIICYNEYCDLRSIKITDALILLSVTAAFITLGISFSEVFNMTVLSTAEDDARDEACRGGG
jgi:hypothetical protein